MLILIVLWMNGNTHGLIEPEINPHGSLLL